MKLSASILATLVTAELSQALVIPELFPKELDLIRKENDDDGKKKIIQSKNNDQTLAPLAPLYLHKSIDNNIKGISKKVFEKKNIVNDNNLSNLKGRFIPNKYIITFKDSISNEQIKFHKELIQQLHIQSLEKLSPIESEIFLQSLEFENNNNNINDKIGGIIDSFKIQDLINGYIGYFTTDMIEIIRKNPLIKSVEMDSIVTINEFNTQNNAPWGLARISHRDSLNLGSFNKYLYDDEAGYNVDAYVIDTGINIHHNDFEKRAVWGKTIPMNDFDEDGNGHGTHCAGTIASKHYGIAKNANVIAIKVLKSNGSGSMSDVIKGVEFAAESHVNKLKDNNGKNKNFKGSVANMSLGGGKSPSLEMVVNAAVRAGLHFAVAAGNENQDACNTSPASAELAITVGATTLSDDRAYFSNWGECVDIFAPGLNILSTYIGNNDATATLSGTSMASPHVAGLLTYFLSLQPEKDSQFSNNNNELLTPQQMKKKLADYSTKDILVDLPQGSPNYLIFNGGGQDLSGFWHNDESKQQEHTINSNEKSLFSNNDFNKYKENLPSTDLMFEQIRNLIDKLNIF